MSYITWRLPTFVALLLIVSTSATTQSPLTAADLEFMTGCWRFEAKGRIVEEHWMAPAGGTTMGISRTVVDGKTTEFEFVQIREVAQGLAFVAKPSNQPEATFIAKSKTAEEIVFENPAHDFPQRIRYRLDGQTLRARVEGTMNGKERGFEFPYTRTNCVP